MQDSIIPEKEDGKALEFTGGIQAVIACRFKSALFSAGAGQHTGVRTGIH